MSARKPTAPRTAIPANADRIGRSASATSDVRLLDVETWRRENAAAIKDHNRRVEAGEFDEFLRRL